MRLAQLAALQAQIEHPGKRQPIRVSGVPGRHPGRFVWYAVLPRRLGGEDMPRHAGISRLTSETAQMTCKIERHTDGHHTTLRLIGHLQAVHLEALQAQLESNGPRTVLDLDEVTLVDVEVVRFLGKCQAAGIRLVHCARYINDWIDTERSSET
jgi:hypothetical protein